MDRKSVFLTYAMSDKEFAQGLADKIRAKGIEISFDPLIGIASGESWAQTIRKAIEKSSAVVAILPLSGTRGSNNTFFEIGLARALNKKVLAVSPDRASSEDRQIPSDLLDLLVLDGANQPADFIVDTLTQALLAA